MYSNRGSLGASNKSFWPLQRTYVPTWHSIWPPPRGPAAIFTREGTVVVLFHVWDHSPPPSIIYFSAYYNIISTQKLKDLRANEILSFSNFSLKSGALEVLQGFQLGHIPVPVSPEFPAVPRKLVLRDLLLSSGESTLALPSEPSFSVSMQ